MEPGNITVAYLYSYMHIYWILLIRAVRNALETPKKKMKTFSTAVWCNIPVFRGGLLNNGWSLDVVITHRCQWLSNWRRCCAGAQRVTTKTEKRNNRFNVWLCLGGCLHFRFHQNRISIQIQLIFLIYLYPCFVVCCMVTNVSSFASWFFDQS